MDQFCVGHIYSICKWAIMQWVRAQQIFHRQSSCLQRSPQLVHLRLLQSRNFEVLRTSIGGIQQSVYVNVFVADPSPSIGTRTGPESSCQSMEKGHRVLACFALFCILMFSVISVSFPAHAHSTHPHDSRSQSTRLQAALQLR